MQTFSLLGLEPGVVGEMIIVGDGELEDDGDEGANVVGCGGDDKLLEGEDELVLLDGVLSEEDELLGLGDIEEIVSGVDVDDLLFDLCAITMSAVLVVSKPAANNTLNIIAVFIRHYSPPIYGPNGLRVLSMFETGRLE
ncbi:MAG: hypothetical protein WAZ77_05070 [Candidatus Nitrosopolaris sp.]